LDPLNFDFPDPKTLSNLSRYLNAVGREKLRESGWLISAIPAKFNHLQGAPPLAVEA